MDLNTKPGSLVRFLGKNGYEGERKRACALLTVGNAYEVESVSVGRFDSSVRLKGIDAVFNTVMFENVMNPPEPIEQSVSPDEPALQTNPYSVVYMRSLIESLIRRDSGFSDEELEEIAQGCEIVCMREPNDALAILSARKLLKADAVPHDGKGHDTTYDTNRLKEAEEIIKLFSGIPIPEEIETGWDCVNVTILNCNIRRARSFLKEEKQ